MTPQQFTDWATRKGFILGASTPGHLGRKDAWTKTFGEHPAKHVRYFIKDRKGGPVLIKEVSRGFGSFVRAYSRLLSDMILVNDRLNHSK